MNLVAAVMASPRPLPLREILGTIAGYDDEAEAETLEKRFDRDRRDLRALGLPIEFVARGAWAEGGYVVRAEQSLQQRMQFTAEEIALVSHAAACTGDLDASGPLPSALLSALRKLACDLPSSFREEGAAPGIFHRDWRTDSELEQRVLTIMLAVAGHETVEFLYAGLSDEPERRRKVDPYGLGLRHGAWYLVGHCHDRGAIRAFRVQRVSGPVQRSLNRGESKAFGIPPGFRLDDHLPRRTRPRTEGCEVLGEAPMSLLSGLPRATILGDSKAPGRQKFRMPLEDLDEAFAWVVRESPQIAVLGPPELVRRLREEVELLRDLEGEAPANLLDEPGRGSP